MADAEEATARLDRDRVVDVLFCFCFVFACQNCVFVVHLEGCQLGNAIAFDLHAVCFELKLETRASQ